MLFTVFDPFCGMRMHVLGPQTNKNAARDVWRKLSLSTPRLVHIPAVLCIWRSYLLHGEHTAFTKATTFQATSIIQRMEMLIFRLPELMGNTHTKDTHSKPAFNYSTMEFPSVKPASNS